MSEAEGEQPSAVRRELASFAELAGLVGFAVVQPVLGPFGESPETFAAAGASPGEIIAFALLVALVPLAVLATVAGMSRLAGTSVRTGVQTALVGLLAGLAGSAFARQAGASAPLRLMAAVAIGVGVAVLHRRAAPARLFLRYTSPVPVLLVLSFLLLSPVSSLVRPASGSSSSDVAPTGGGAPPVLMIVLDELPTLSVADGSGGVEADLFPNLGRLADTSTWYRDHTGVSPSTVTALPALLTGRLPEDPMATRAATALEHPENLLTLLARTHAVNAQEWVTDLCPSSDCPDPEGDLDDLPPELTTGSTVHGSSTISTLTDQARSLWWSQAWPTASDFDAGFALGGASDPDALSVRSLQFLAAMDESGDGRPTFDFLHTALPHQPWRLLPDGRTHDGPEEPFGSEFLRTWPGGDVGEQLALGAQTSHLLQLQWADRIVGAIFDRMDELGRWDDALVIVTADHGVSFEPLTSTRDLTPENQEHIAWTPLFVKFPGQREGRVVDDPVDARDVVPTVLDVLGVDVDWELEGRSLLESAPPTVQPRPFVLQFDNDFASELRPGIVELDGDGLAAIERGGRSADPDDPLAVWRHGRHGALIGRSVDDLGVCDEPGPSARRTPSPGWNRLVEATLPDDAPRPLWHEGTVDTEASIDVAASVDGVVVAWGVTSPTTDGNRFGLLFAEPLSAQPSSEPVLHQIVDDSGCRLRPLAG